MSITRASVFDPQGLQRVQNPGDIVCTNESVPATNAGTAVTLTAALLSLGLYLSSAGSAPTLTLDSAANIVAGLAPQFGYNQNAAVPAGTPQYASIQPGTAFRFRIIAPAFAVTVAATANTGVTVNRGTVAASTSRDFLVTFNNGTPVQTFAGTTTNASAVVGGFSQLQLSQLSVGMVVTNAVAGLQGTTIIGINYAAGTVTMSGNANATNSVPVAITFSPVITIDGL